MDTCSHDEIFFWSISVGDTIIEIKLILVKRAVLNISPSTQKWFISMTIQFFDPIQSLDFDLLRSGF